MTERKDKGAEADQGAEADSSSAVPVGPAFDGSDVRKGHAGPANNVGSHTKDAADRKNERMRRTEEEGDNKKNTKRTEERHEERDNAEKRSAKMTSLTTMLL